MFGRRGGKERPAPEWSRQKMLALLIGVGVTALVFVVGVVLAMVYAVHPARHTAEHSNTGATSAGSDGDGGAGSGGPSTVADPKDALADKADDHRRRRRLPPWACHDG